MMDWYHNGMGWGGWLVMTLAVVAFWALLIALLVALFRGSDKQPNRADSRGLDDPLDILAERFARGEIDAEEYRNRQDVLRDSPRSH